MSDLLNINGCNMSDGKQSKGEALKSMLNESTLRITKQIEQNPVLSTQHGSALSRAIDHAMRDNRTGLPDDDIDEESGG